MLPSGAHHPFCTSCHRCPDFQDSCSVSLWQLCFPILSLPSATHLHKVLVKARDNPGPGLQTHSLLRRDADSAPCYWFHVCFICKPCQARTVSHSFPCPAQCKLLHCNLWQQNNCKKQTRSLLGKKRGSFWASRDSAHPEHAIFALFSIYLPIPRSVSKLIP